jgi:hypothetical protein
MINAACKTPYPDSVRVLSLPHSESPSAAQHRKPSKCLSAKCSIEYYLQSLPVCKQYEAGEAIKQTAQCCNQHTDRHPISQFVEQPPHQHFFQLPIVCIRTKCKWRGNQKTPNYIFLESIRTIRTLVLVNLQGSTDIWRACRTNELFEEIINEPHNGTHIIVACKVASLPTEDTSIPMSSLSTSLLSSTSSLSVMISPSSPLAPSSSTDPRISPLCSPSAPSPKTPPLPSLAEYQPPLISTVHLGVLSDENDTSKEYLQVTQV